MLGLFSRKKVKEMAAKQQKAQLKLKMDANAAISMEMRKLVRIISVVPNRYWDIEPNAIHRLNNVHRDNQDEIFGFCESRVPADECWRRSISDPTQPNSCWDCEKSHIAVICPTGEISTVKNIRSKEHHLKLSSYGME